MLEEFEQAAVALVYATDGVVRIQFCVGEQDQSAATTGGGTLDLAQIAVRAGGVGAQLREKFGFKIRRDGMFQPLGFVVNLPPFHAEHFGKHALDRKSV